MQLISFQQPPSILISLSFHVVEALGFSFSCNPLPPLRSFPLPITPDGFCGSICRLCMEYLFLHTPSSVSLDFGYRLNHAGWSKYRCRSTEFIRPSPFSFSALLGNS